MPKNKTIFITAFALFSLFFGAGNLILPPLLGLKSGNSWIWVTLGFSISAVVIPILGILAHAKLQGTLLDFSKKIHPIFSYTFCFIIYIISISLPSPRTASVTHEMAIAPFFDIPSSITSTLFFAVVFIFVINRSSILSVIGKFLTPFIFIIIVAIIVIGTFMPHSKMVATTMVLPFTDGIIEGYQTFDCIGAVLIGAVVIISLHLKGHTSYAEKKTLITKAGIIAGLALFFVYAGLIYSGAIFNGEFSSEITRTALLSSISIATLGNIGNLFLSVLVGLACFTTAVGIITGTADFVKGICNNSTKAFLLTAFFGSFLGVLIGQYNVGFIIQIAIPVLLILYPLTIILIFLNLLPDSYGTPLIFRSVAFVTILFSIPDFIGAIGFENMIRQTKDIIPLSNLNMGWILPALLCFISLTFYQRVKLKA